MFAPIPNDTILDDVVIPMLIAMEGYRVAYDREAIAYDPQALDPVRETIRKQRTLIGNYQMLIRYPRWLLPWHNRLWWQLISHKYLRLLAPVFLMLAFVANLSLIASPYYATLLVGQCCFYLCALVGICNPSNRTRLFSLPGGFLFLNVMVLRSLGTFLFNSHPSWPKPAGNRSHQD